MTEKKNTPQDVPQWILPNGDSPLETVPTEIITAGEKPKTHMRFSVALERHEQVINAVLTEEMDRVQLNHANDFQVKFFIVDLDFDLVKNAKAPAKTAFDKFLKDFSKPGSSVISALVNRRPISLPELIKLGLAFEAALRFEGHDAIQRFELQEGNRLTPSNGPMVVPVRRSVRPLPERREAWSYRKEALQGKFRNLPFAAIRTWLGATDEGFVNYVKALGFPPPSKAIFTSHLDRGYLAGTKTRGWYLITDVLAKLIHAYIGECAGEPNFMPIDELFPNDIKQMPGHGRTCTALEYELGNYLQMPTRANRAEVGSAGE